MCYSEGLAYNARGLKYGLIVTWPEDQLALSYRLLNRERNLWAIHRSQPAQVDQLVSYSPVFLFL